MEESSLNEMKKISTLMESLLAKLGSEFVAAGKLPPDELVSIERAAEIMGVSVSTAYRRSKAGLIKSDKILGMLYFSRNQLIEVATTLGAVKPKKDS